MRTGFSKLFSCFKQLWKFVGRDVSTKEDSVRWLLCRSNCPWKIPIFLLLIAVIEDFKIIYDMLLPLIHWTKNRVMLTTTLFLCRSWTLGSSLSTMNFAWVIPQPLFQCHCVETKIGWCRRQHLLSHRNWISRYWDSKYSRLLQTYNLKRVKILVKIWKAMFLNAQWQNVCQQIK